MKRTFLLLVIMLAALLPNVAVAQELTVTYTAKMNVNSPKAFEAAGVPKEMRQMMIGAYRDIEFTFCLYLQNGESEYRMLPSDKKQVIKIMGQEFDLNEGIKEQLKNITYRNHDSNLTLDKVGVFGKTFLIKDTIAIQEFLETDEPSREVLGYECKKAVSKDGNQIVWYAPLIPINEGLLVTNLKGLILSGETDQYIFTASSITEGVDHKIIAPTEGKEMSRKDFDDMLKKRMDLMNR